jgi:replicative DNA helicase
MPRMASSHLWRVPSPASRGDDQEAEQSLLGAILYRNHAYETVAGFLRPEHFLVPAHGCIFGAIATLIARGDAANPVTLKAYFRHDADLSDVGGAEYLAELAANVISVSAAEDYGRVIHDLFLRRELTTAAEEAITLAGNADPNRPAAQLIDLISERLFDLAERNTTGRVLVTASTMVEQTLARAQVAWKAEGRVTGATTGLADLDRVLGGLQPCQLVILGARPGMGKSALAANTTMLAAARASVPVGMFSLEMPAREIGARHLAGITGIGVDRQQQGRLDATDFPTLVQAGSEVSGLPLGDRRDWRFDR